MLGLLAVHVTGLCDLRIARKPALIINDRVEVPHVKRAVGGDGVKAVLARDDLAFDGVGLADLKLDTTALELVIEAFDRDDRRGLVFLLGGHGGALLR